MVVAVVVVVVVEEEEKEMSAGQLEKLELEVFVGLLLGPMLTFPEAKIESMSAPKKAKEM